MEACLQLLLRDELGEERGRGGGEAARKILGAAGIGIGIALTAAFGLVRAGIAGAARRQPIIAGQSLVGSAAVINPEAELLGPRLVRVGIGGIGFDRRHGLTGAILSWNPRSPASNNRGRQIEDATDIGHQQRDPLAPQLWLGAANGKLDSILDKLE